MKKKIFILFIILISNSILGQNRDIEYDYYASELYDIEINEILNYPLMDLNENETTAELKEKLKSDLNTIASCVVHYKFAKTLKLTPTQQTVLEKRIVDIADKFADQEKYVLIEMSGGYSPTFGIKENMISGKKVLILMLGGDCLTTEMDVKQEKIYSLFNDQMNIRISK